MNNDREITVGSIWKHYKGAFYIVLHVAYNSHSSEENDVEPKNGELFVVYMATYNDNVYGNRAVWIRKKAISCALKITETLSL